MKPVGRLSAFIALTLLLSPGAFAGEPASPKARAKNNKEGRRAGTVAGEKVAPAATPAKTAVPAARPARPAGIGARTAPAPRPARPAQAADEDKPVLRPTPATSGTLGLFTMETGDTLPRKAVGTSVYVNKYSREPGSLSVLNLGWNVSYGLTDRVSTYLVFEPHRHVHVSRPGRLSFNSPIANPQFQSTIYRSLTPTPGTAPGYAEDVPFAGHNGGGIGDWTLGLQWGLWSERRGNPLSFSLRGDLIIPSRTQLTDLLDVQAQNGAFNFNVGLAASKTWRDLVTAVFNWGYRFTRDPRFDGVRALRQADQMRFGVGFLAFPEKRMQLMSEYSALVFAGRSTQTTTFGARDPVEIISGVRLYPWRNLAMDFGYRNVVNLRAHGDRNGFVVKAGFLHWPVAAPKPVNRPPAASCTADKSSLYAESGDIVNVTARGSDPDGDALNYSWSASGGRVEGGGTAVRWNSAGTQPGVYTVTARVDDGMGGTASCSVDIRVEPRPNRAPSVSCSAERSSVLSGERVRIRAEASDPDGDRLTYSWRSNAGQIVGSGASVQLDTSGLSPGRYTVTGRVEDGRGGAADCSATVGVEVPPPPPQASKLNECFFRQGSARVDNVCKRILDDVALRLQNDPRAKVVLVGYADPREPRADRLARQRADAARKYLGEKGIAEARSDVRAAGGQAGAGKQNRRLDVIWVPEGATY